MIQVFVNNKPYSQSVPTPNGGGREVPPGHYVEGDYFKILAQYKILDPMLVEQVDPKLLVFTYGNRIIVPSKKELPKEPVKVVELPKPVITVVQPVEPTLKSMEDVANAVSVAFNDSSTKKDTSKMNLDELRSYAKALGLNVQNTETKRELIKLIALKEN